MTGGRGIFFTLSNRVTLAESPLGVVGGVVIAVGGAISRVCCCGGVMGVAGEGVVGSADGVLCSTVGEGVEIQGGSVVVGVVVWLSVLCSASLSAGVTSALAGFASSSLIRAASVLSLGEALSSTCRLRVLSVLSLLSFFSPPDSSRKDGRRFLTVELLPNEEGSFFLEPEFAPSVSPSSSSSSENRGVEVGGVEPGRMR